MTAPTLRALVRTARPERYIPAHLLQRVLGDARHNGDAATTRCLLREMRRRHLRS
jgi:hypothetical protein